MNSEGLSFWNSTKKLALCFVAMSVSVVAGFWHLALQQGAVWNLEIKFFEKFLCFGKRK
jgi:hypothetical protein